MMLMYSFHSTPPQSPLSLHRLLTTAKLHRRRQDDYRVDGDDCCLIGVVLGVTMEKYLPVTILSNICECLPLSINPVPVLF